MFDYVLSGQVLIHVFKGNINGVGVFFLMIRRPPRSTQSRSSAASDVYKRQLIFLHFTCRNKILTARQTVMIRPDIK